MRGRERTSPLQRVTRHAKCRAMAPRHDKRSHAVVHQTPLDSRPQHPQPRRDHDELAHLVADDSDR